jgi:hypothetical protein
MNRYFYITTDGKQKGAFSPEELRHENVRRETLVWTQDMPQWERAEEVEELKYLFTGAPPPQAPVAEEELPPPPMPKTWLTESVLATVLPFICFWSIFSLLGIIGIIYATQVESLYRRGEYEAAQAASRNAGRWARVALWIVFGWIIFLVLTAITLVLFFSSLLITAQNWIFQ